MLILAAAALAADAPRPPAFFTLTSTDIAPGGRKIAEAQVFNGFGRKGGNVSPAARLEQRARGHPELCAPHARPRRADRQRLVALDRLQHPRRHELARRGCRGCAQERAPAGRLRPQGRTDFGTAGYGGPCPPPGKAHHYHFYLYALKATKLDLPADATAAFIGFNVHAQAIGKPAELTGLYGR